MKKRIITLSIIAILVFFTTIIIISNKVDGQIKITYPLDIKELDILGRQFVNKFNSASNVEGSVVVNNSSSYLSDIRQDMMLEEGSDLYYVVNSSTLKENDIIDGTMEFKLKNFDYIPRSFKTFSSNSRFFRYIPITYAPWGIYYNRSIFKEHNLKEPKTFEELEVLVSNLIKIDKTPFSMTQGLKWPLTSWFDYLSIREYGGTFHNRLLSGYESFTSEKVKSLFYNIYDLINNGWFKLDNDSDWTIMVSDLVQGESAMMLSSTFFYDEIATNSKENIGWFPFPSSNFNDEIVTSSGYIVSQKSENIKGVKALIDFSYSRVGQSFIEKNSQLHPIDKNSNRDDLSKGLKHIKLANYLLPSFERNNNNTLLIPLKFTLNKLFTIDSKSEIDNILIQLELLRNGQ